MDKVVKWFCIMTGICAIFGIISYLHDLWIHFPLGLLIVAILALIILGAIVKERWRRRKEGYFVYLQGGAEDGTVMYNEGGKLIELYFDRLKSIIYVPSDAKWKRVMPDWAKTRKAEIMRRIKKHIGGWKYEESDMNSFSRL